MLIPVTLPCFNPGDIEWVVGVQTSIHLITDDIFIGIQFTSWSLGGPGGFTYFRAPAVGMSPPSD